MYYLGSDQECFVSVVTETWGASFDSSWFVDIQTIVSWREEGREDKRDRGQQRERQGRETKRERERDRGRGKQGETQGERDKES